MKKIFTLLCVASLVALACNREPEPEPGPTPGNNPAIETDGLIPNAVTDYDGNVYDAVRIGQQVWMASNLHVKHFANGEEIPVGGSNTSLTQPFLYYPDENFDVDKYGYFYNWPAAVKRAGSSEANPSGTQGVCPNGWHLPSDAEWEQLRTYCANKDEFVCETYPTYSTYASCLASNSEWESCNVNCSPGYDLSSNNASGFNAFPAGLHFGHDGYIPVGTEACFWGATGCDGCTYAYCHYLFNNSNMLNRGRNDKDNGYSVRCVKD
ncbi:MAG: hypothetical protein IKQ20_10625 [Bacteroidales bacterium]|nr:hypothetical protein [Bacteroidales bacterium]